MDEAEVFYNLIKREYAQSIGVAQSHLICSSDVVLLMLLARLIVEKDCAGKFFSPDVHVFPSGENKQALPSVDKNGAIITHTGKLSVADIDEITTTAAITPLELDYKYYIIKNAETLNDASSNKLLKTLEEPPKTVKIILLAQSEYAVLPTIRSRCRIFSPAPLNAHLLGEAADQIFKDSPHLAKAKIFGGGNITRLVRAALGGFENIEGLVFDTLLGMKNSSRQAEFAQKIVKQKTDLGDIISIFELVLADALLFCSGTNPRLNYRNDDIKAIAQFYAIDAIIRLKPVFDRARARLKLFGNAASVVDEFLFSLLETRQKTQP